MVKGKHKTAGIPDLDIDFKQLLDGLDEELLIIDSEYRVKFANSAVRSRFQEDTETLINRHCYELFLEEDKPCSTPLWSCPLKEVIKKGNPSTVIHSKGMLGADRYIKITAYPLHNNYSGHPCIVEFRRDVSAERELESQILRRHHQLLALNHISSAVSGLWDLDIVLGVALDNVLEIINGAIGGILLLDEDNETLSYRVQRGLSAKYTEHMLIHIGEGVAGRVAQTGEAVLLEDISKSPQAALPDLVSAEGLKGFISIPLKAKEDVVGVMNIASQLAGRFSTDDLSLLNSIGDYLGTAIEQAKLYEGLRTGRERYQRLLHHALHTQEEERKRIARELHDETSQAITSLTLNLQAIIGTAEMQGIGDAEFMEKLRTTHSCAIHAGNEIVKLMKELRPTLLDELGLSAAIHRYAKDTLQNRGISVSAEFTGTDRRFGPDIEVTLFRTAQGIIGNILEHAEARNVSIKLEYSDGMCRLQITDDGKGFEVSKLTRVDPSGRGTGLFTMKERVSLVGGICHIESRPTHGTNVCVNIPVQINIEADNNEEDKSAGSR